MKSTASAVKVGQAGTTHEEFFAAVRALLVARVSSPEARQRLAGAKVVYGAGNRGARGVTFFSAWHDGAAHQDVLQVCADGEETSNPLQLPGTTIHEAAHVVAGPQAGHGPAWKAAAAALGLVNAEASGQSYRSEDFAPEVFAALDRIPTPTDGRPAFRTRGGEQPKRRPCQLGIGTRGGKSRGTGSGSRLRLWVCSCERPVKVRVASDDFQATCSRCGHAFKRGETA
jgi:hypothetical protein